MTSAIAVTSEPNQLGEGVRWDARRDELLRVDILAGRVYRDRIDEAGGLIPVRTYDVPGMVGAIAPIDGDDGWVLAANRGFYHLSLDGSLRHLADVTPEGTRMNDAACDPQGRFWAGTKAHDNHEGGGETTACAFAGSGLHWLYVTSATEHWTDEQRAADPAAGLVYRVETRATGRPAAPFRPDRVWWA
jgi:sugar lactone lactonase YvrE